MTGEIILFYFPFCCCMLRILSESFLKFTTLFPSDYLPYGSGGNDEFWEDTPAHSPSVNVVGAVTATGLKLPLLFLDGPFNQVVYLDWLQRVKLVQNAAILTLTPTDASTQPSQDRIKKQ